MLNSKKKGNKWENEIATVIRNHFVPGTYDAVTAHGLVHRTPMSGGHVERGDLIIKPPIWRWFPWFVECRNRESWLWKNLMERGHDSLIGKWFQEDAIDKCHPYDNDAQYPRRPLLLFTKNYNKVYFCAKEEDLGECLFCGFGGTANIADEFDPSLWLDSWVIGSFDTFLGWHSVTDEVAQDIDKYLGITS